MPLMQRWGKVNAFTDIVSIQAARVFVLKQFIQINSPKAASFPDRSGFSWFSELQPLKYHFF